MSLPLLPVTTGTFLGLVRVSNTMGRWTHGMKKCVPSPITVSFTPENRSKMTARCPASTGRRDRVRRFSCGLFCQFLGTFH